MRQEQVTCDSCGRDLTTTGNAVGYRLVLASQPIPSIPSSSGTVTLVHVNPIIDREKHFCSTKCLAAWVIQNCEESGKPIS